MSGNFWQPGADHPDAYPSFRKRFGQMHIDKNGEVDYQIPARWMAGLGNAAGCTAIVGVIVSRVWRQRFLTTAAQRLDC